MNAAVNLSDLLAARRAEILERWTRRIGIDHAKDHEDNTLSRGELWDHLPHIFDELLAALRAEEGSRAAEASEDNAASAEHGSQRIRVGFDLTEVVREYDILTDCILEEVAGAGGILSVRAFRRVQAKISAGRSEAVAAYIERRDIEAARAHSQHIAFVAHELRNPLQNAVVVAAVLRGKAHSSNDGALSMLDRNLVAMRELIDQVLIADRLAGNVPLHRETLDLRMLLAQVLADARSAAEHRHLTLVLEAPDALLFNADQRLLRSAVGNLLGNAIKFTRAHQVVTIRAAHREGCVSIEVEDRCGGLPQGDAAGLFEPFVQRGENRTGLGLGLAIVKQAVEAHGGSVQVRNLPDCGCIFSLEFPDPSAN